MWRHCGNHKSVEKSMWYFLADIQRGQRVLPYRLSLDRPQHAVAGIGDLSFHPPNLLSRFQRPQPQLNVMATGVSLSEVVVSSEPREVERLSVTLSTDTWQACGRLALDTTQRASSQLSWSRVGSASVHQPATKSQGWRWMPQGHSSLELQCPEVDFSTKFSRKPSGAQYLEAWHSPATLDPWTEGHWHKGALAPKCICTPGLRVGPNTSIGIQCFDALRQH